MLVSLKLKQTFFIPKVYTAVVAYERDINEICLWWWCHLAWIACDATILFAKFDSNSVLM